MNIYLKYVLMLLIIIINDFKLYSLNYFIIKLLCELFRFSYSMNQKHSMINYRIQFIIVNII